MKLCSCLLAAPPRSGMLNIPCWKFFGVSLGPAKLGTPLSWCRVPKVAAE